MNHAGVYIDIAGGTPSPVAIQAREALAVENARRIAEIAETDPGRLADLMTESTGRFLDAVAGCSGDLRVVFHENTPMDLASLVCICLGEHLLHGYDIATAARFPCPSTRSTPVWCCTATARSTRTCSTPSRRRD